VVQVLLLALDALPVMIVQVAFKPLVVKGVIVAAVVHAYLARWVTDVLVE